MFEIKLHYIWKYWLVCFPFFHHFEYAMSLSSCFHFYFWAATNLVFFLFVRILILFCSYFLPYMTVMSLLGHFFTLLKVSRAYWKYRYIIFIKFVNFLLPFLLSFSSLGECVLIIFFGLRFLIHYSPLFFLSFLHTG